MRAISVTFQHQVNSLYIVKEQLRKRKKFFPSEQNQLVAFVYRIFLGVAIACFTWFVLSSSSNILNPSVAFVALTIFNKLRRPMALVAPAVQFISKAIVSSKRINEFLQADELIRQKGSANDEAPSIITLNVNQGELHAIVGSFGSGKSSLLSAILGEMTQLDGVKKISGTIAYVPQTAWILNHTVRSNILYGLDYDRNKYDKVLRACELKKDIFSLPRCDATIVGENGMALSGGQRARICLARALYQDCDIFLLDDPFSAVDATVSRSMYEKLLGADGLLSGKTVILSTQSIEFTKKATVIHVMDGGKIVDRGTYEELVERSSVFSEIKRELEELQKKRNNSEESCEPKRIIFSTIE
ncbi:ABC transporter, ATP-binding protein, partial [Cooperia oncophora]